MRIVLLLISLSLLSFIVCVCIYTNHTIFIFTSVSLVRCNYLLVVVEKVVASSIEVEEEEGNENRQSKDGE